MLVRRPQGEQKTVKAYKGSDSSLEYKQALNKIQLETMLREGQKSYQHLFYLFNPASWFQ